ncbi:uncharacterized protein FA14DRAFT_188833 [Meira miltonrushii]|uniref:Uncharacterized protein n=1 Tax=Meira miltonrushii TaxID=1280837 RepID=A0A316VAW4_9BASI|nr:uncharacterized protein FA14DRAFT_188833 [Meira miltonrushii]PWN34779.1 hypothetical protein FA14DRAFT_188833 [Meira miltonrushii]
MPYHCWYCGESSDDYEFYLQHQVTASFTVHFRSGDSVTVHRASDEDGGCCKITSPHPGFYQNHIVTQKLVVWNDNGIPFILHRNPKTHANDTKRILALLMAFWAIGKVSFVHDVWLAGILLIVDEEKEER